jgi:DNA helicase-2/ATP-dependent DNA helicase PcrA
MPSSNSDLIISEEIQILEQKRRIIIENPIGFESSEKELIEQLIILRSDVLAAKDEDLPPLYNQMDNLNAALTAVKNYRNREELDPESPYFAHLRLKEGKRTRDVFLGKATNLDHGLRIVDWRNAPISKLFYRYSEGDEYEEEFGSVLREGQVVARRILHIQRGELLRVANSEHTWVRDAGKETWTTLEKSRVELAGGEGSAFRSGSTLSSELGSGSALRSSKHLPDIAALIDPEQFDLISAEHDGVMVIRGSAGSGKTTVALHRISFLCFEAPKRFIPEKMMFIVWGKAMRDYVAHVLPNLDIQGVKVNTWNEWSLKRFRAHFQGWPSLTTEITPDSVRQVKLHPSTMHRLEEWIESTPKKPKTLHQVYEDWAHVLTDTYAIKRDFTSVLTIVMRDRAIDWLMSQTELVEFWLEASKQERDPDTWLDEEDIALLLRAYQLRIGPLKEDGRVINIAHLVVDEVQDFSPIEILVLLGICDHSKSVTLAGDTRQHISKSAGFSSWSQFLGELGITSTSLSTLQVAYRSSRQIVTFSQKLLSGDETDETPPLTVKDGPPVELFKFSDHGACVAFLAEELRKLQEHEPKANIALLTPTERLADAYYDGLKECAFDSRPELCFCRRNRYR